MSLDLVALLVDARDPNLLARFWDDLLGTSPFALRFVANPSPKTVPNQMHLDLTSSSLADQRAIVDRALSLGATHLDVGQRPEEGHVVLADPEGNELCVVGPGNRFLADTGPGRVGALSCDGSRQVGLFWSAALGWPLVWDQDEETAIQSPLGGPKIAWGGPPYAEKVGRNRVRLELAPSLGSDLEQEVRRLVALGATRLDGDELADPDGNEFRLTVPG